MRAESTRRTLETARLSLQNSALELPVLAGTDGRRRNADQARPPDGRFVAIYSLIEPAAARAAAIIRRWYPEVRVETLGGKVGQRRAAVRRQERRRAGDRRPRGGARRDGRDQGGPRPPTHPVRTGKGTVSLVEAVLAGIDEIYGANPR